MKLPFDMQPLKSRLQSVSIDMLTPDIEPLRSSVARDNPDRDQFFQLVRDVKWFILISLLLSALLYAPDQIGELYRVTYANVCWNWHPKWFLGESSSCVNLWLLARSVLGLIWFYLTVFAIGLLIWFGANQVATASIVRMKKVAGWVVKSSWVIPAILGGLPLIACALGHLTSIPEALEVEAVTQADNAAVGESAQIKAQIWADSVRIGLTFGAVLTLVLGLALSKIAYELAKALDFITEKLNEEYFYRGWFLLGAVFVFTGLSLAFVWWPVPLPQLLTVFGVIALFTLCLVAFCLYFSLLTVARRVPIIFLILFWAFLLSFFDWNDNHKVRIVAPRTDAGEPKLAVRTAAEEFERWYESRPKLDAYDEYPVYIVAAQGGGMYAAYQTGIFLARMQDNCPAFRNHLFAISSVSGGSVGAATFVSALRFSEEAAKRNAAKAAAAAESVSGGFSDPCPAITEYFRAVHGRSAYDKDGGEEPAAQTDEKTGELEKIVRKTLGTDLLSPLAAATLFPDFAQRFIPAPFEFLDRARALELAFEFATAGFDPQDQVKPFSESFLRHWSATGSTPALFMNATDAGSGRRVLISPFALHPESLATTATMQFPFFPKAAISKDPAKDVRLGAMLDIALSTAAGISARFPWLTPAATIDVSDGRIGGKTKKIRLVDGGYVDNSGVETVLDLLQSIASVRDKIDQAVQDGKKLPDGTRPYRKIQINLIVLSGGTYSERSSFALGETMEPIRGLLSARASRAYVAIDRASYAFPERKFETRGRTGAVQEVKISGLRVGEPEELSYQMPLGWALSKRTREIIEEQSGSYATCDFNEKFMQSSDKLPQSDCIHLMTYHLLNRSLGAKLEDIRQLKSAQGVAGLSPKDYGSKTEGAIQSNAASSPRLDQNRILTCYRGKGETGLSPVQVSSLQELLNIWDRRFSDKDDRWLAFILGSLAYETGDFRVQIQNMSFRSAELISTIWRREFPKPEDALPYVNNPEALANRVYRGRFGNIEEGDGFRYRGRGMVQLTGRGNYQKYGALIGENLERNPDLVLRPDIGARVAFAQFLPDEKQSLLQDYFNEKTDNWTEARRAFSGGLMGVEAVTTKGKAFLQCIKDSKKVS